MKYICSICGYVYDEDKGVPELGIAAGTKWVDVPDNFNCPWCGAEKSAFNPEAPETVSTPETQTVAKPLPHVEKEMSAIEMSILCSNLARGCEKQYLFDESEDFKTLANFFSQNAEDVVDDDFNALLNLINEDLELLPLAMNIAKDHGDRGAQRAITWSTKVTTILKTLVDRYLKMGDQMLENTGVFVCTACGFVFVGDKAPEICPVCKVPSWKFEEVK